MEYSKFVREAVKMYFFWGDEVLTQVQNNAPTYLFWDTPLGKVILKITCGKIRATVCPLYRAPKFVYSQYVVELVEIVNNKFLDKENPFELN